MKVVRNYVNLEAQFESYDDIHQVECDYNLKVINITEIYMDDAHRKGIQYCGPSVYMFIGNRYDLVNYFVNGYPANDIEEVKNFMRNEIKVLNLDI